MKLSIEHTNKFMRLKDKEDTQNTWFHRSMCEQNPSQKTYKTQWIFKT